MAGSVQAAGLIDEDRALPPEPGPVSLLRKIDRALGRLESFALTLVLLGLIGLGVFQVVCKHWFPPAPYWVMEVIKYSVFFIGMIGGALAAQSNRLFNIDMLTRLFGARGRLAIRVLTALFTIFICWMFLRSGWRLRTKILDEEGDVLPPATGLLPLPIGAALIGVHMAIHALIDLYYLTSGKPSPDLHTEPAA